MKIIKDISIYWSYRGCFRDTFKGCYVYRVQAILTRIFNSDRIELW